MLFDQMVKFGVAASMPLGTHLDVTLFFNLMHVLNPGVAFSFLARAGGWRWPPSCCGTPHTWSAAPGATPEQAVDDKLPPHLSSARMGAHRPDRRLHLAAA
ncbi:signal peptidase II [Rhodanobacter denitrificans]|uniref:signal peptidase II n=1 Tax=Rhodanobacter denitrificans TaxID=666685 RepID=UPI003CE518CC